ncbi:MAG: (Fe-S)-binding protein [Candidatus Korarchaeota archaeon]|nr:(Fe-S)-binding protein [Candidatus Korarchaeota archaeon]
MDLKAVKLLLEKNAKKTWNPLGVKEEYCSMWAEGMNFPERGEVLLYTGCLYQMIPYIDMFARLLKGFESMNPALFGIAMKIKALADSLGLDTISLLASLEISKKDRERYFRIVRSIANALLSAGVKFAYMREEPYSGVLYHDLGMDDLFREHVMRLAKKIKETGARKVITIDPHTTYMLNYLIKEFVDDFEVEVVHYMDVLLERGYTPKVRGPKEVVIHDPCYLARWNGVIDQPRVLLSRAGVKVREPEFTRKFTGCCGGPIESLFPSLSSKLARKRMEELKETGSPCFTVMCPICLTNFQREARELGVRVFDIMEVIE